MLIEKGTMKEINKEFMMLRMQERSQDQKSIWETEDIKTQNHQSQKTTYRNGIKNAKDTNKKSCRCRR